MITIEIDEDMARGIIKEWKKIPDKFAPITQYFGETRHAVRFKSKYPNLKKLVDMLTDLVGEYER